MGAGNPTRSVATRGSTTTAAGFLRAGAQAVFAEGINSVSFVLSGLFKTTRTISSIFWHDPAYKGTYHFKFNSTRTPGKSAIMDPYAPSRYYKSAVGDLYLSAATWRNG